MHLQTLERLQEAVTRDREEEKLPGAAGTILFVEDEAFVRDVTCEVLHRQDTAFCPQRVQLRRCDFTISIAAKSISYSRTWFFPVRPG